MNVELQRTIKPTLILCGVGMIIGFFFDYRISLSILVGTLVSILHLNRLERSITKGLANQQKLGGWAFMFFTDFILLAIPFMLAIIFPQVFELIGAAIGLLINKFVIYGMNIRRKEK
ncbi:ATP synthase subunit I [Anaerorhabdus sp.]|jgi:hypothetical protein|uniref:ATP synthase subunit I n=1 Tax=Anaerorhabdus sp. TaxID=1872524 RepID=UPI002FC65C97